MARPYSDQHFHCKYGEASPLDRGMCVISDRGVITVRSKRDGWVRFRQDVPQFPTLSTSRTSHSINQLVLLDIFE